MQVYLPIAELSLNVVLLLMMGFAIGFLSGMFGVGGGFILTPMLIFLGVPPAVAVGTGASQVVAASVSGAVGHWRRNNIDLQMGFILTAGGFVGALLGVRLLAYMIAHGQLEPFVAISYVVMLGVVGTLMLIESLRVLRAAPAGKVASSMRRGGQHTWLDGLPFKVRFRHSRIYASLIPFLAIGAVVGLLTAIMGVGGGFLLVPAMIYLLRIPTRIVIGTSTVQILCVTAFTTVLQAATNFTVDVLLSVPLMAGSVVGAQFGVGFSERFKAEQLRALLALIVLAVAVRMAFGLVIKPSDLYSIEVPN
ncbi:MAG TPA: sulfite exporter TauE/SafE family protein [Hyphomicrobiaceae bacterium]|nr:sulfite exporter TauE/SafE family protein [Hyphomicrobiaceae bacterium]